MFKWLKNWIVKKKLKKINQTLNQNVVLDPELRKKLSKMGIEKIRMCYPDRYGDIGPGDDYPENFSELEAMDNIDSNNPAINE